MPSYQSRFQPAQLLQTIESSQPALEDSPLPAQSEQMLRRDGPPVVGDCALTQSLKLLETIQAAIRAGDVDAIRQTADALKGPVTSVFAKEAFIATSALERAERNDDLALAQDACRRLKGAITSLNSR